MILCFVSIFYVSLFWKTVFESLLLHCNVDDTIQPIANTTDHRTSTFLFWQNYCFYCLVKKVEFVLYKQLVLVFFFVAFQLIKNKIFFLRFLFFMYILFELCWVNCEYHRPNHVHVPFHRLFAMLFTTELYLCRGGFRGGYLVTCHPLFSDRTLQSEILVMESLFLTLVSKFIRKYYPAIFIHVLHLL